MTSVIKIALGVAVGALAAAYLGPYKLAVGGVLVAAGAYAWDRFVTRLFFSS